MTNFVRQNDVAPGAVTSVEAVVLHGSDDPANRSHLLVEDCGGVQKDAHSLLGAGVATHDIGVAPINPQLAVLRNVSVLVDANVGHNVLGGQLLNLVVRAVTTADHQQGISNTETATSAVVQLRVEVVSQLAVWPRNTASLVGPSKQHRIVEVLEVRHRFLLKSPEGIIAEAQENGSLDCGHELVAGYPKLGGVK